MNKKLLALLLVSAMAVQIKAVGSDPENGGAQTPPTEELEKKDLNSNDNPENPVGAGVSSEKTSPKPSPKVSPETSPRTPRKNSDSPQPIQSVTPPAAAGAPQPFFQPVPNPVTFVTPGAQDNVAIAVLKRVRNKVWTVAVKGDATCDDKQMLVNILKDGAKNFDRLNASQKATYYNAQDAQYGLKTTRFFKAAKLLMVAGLFKVVRDVIKEDADEDDEDEA